MLAFHGLAESVAHVESNTKSILLDKDATLDAGYRPRIDSELFYVHVVSASHDPTDVDLFRSRFRLQRQVGVQSRRTVGCLVADTQKFAAHQMSQTQHSYCQCGCESVCLCGRETVKFRLWPFRCFPAPCSSLFTLYGE